MGTNNAIGNTSINIMDKTLKLKNLVLKQQGNSRLFIFIPASENPVN